MLVFAYIAHFEGEMGIGAHSYFRYNTHLGLLFMAAVVTLARSWNRRKLAKRSPRLVPAVLVLLVLLDPFPFLRMLRFDLEVPSLRVWDLAHEAAAEIAPNEALILILPGENGSVAPALEGVLRYTPPRRPDVALTVVTDPRTALAASADRRALLSCAPLGFDDVPAGTAALLARDASAWRAEHVWPYAPVPPHARWSQVLSPAVLCLGG
jgi:hypothetical protein